MCCHRCKPIGAHGPYFEVLCVNSQPAARWPALAAELRKLRRPDDDFIYEPIFVGSFGDAFCAAAINPAIISVVLAEGFPYRSRHDAPVRSVLDPLGEPETSDESALRLAQTLKRIRPELDVFLLSDRRSSSWPVIRRRMLCGASSMLAGNRWNRTSPFWKASGRATKAFLRQSQEICAPTDRHLPRPPNRSWQVSSTLTGFVTWRILRDQSVPGRKQRQRVGSTACSSRPASAHRNGGARLRR
jgi:hypothetical protein